MLADIWPSAEEVQAAIESAVTPELFRSTYASVFDGDERWRSLRVPQGDRYAWDDTSTYIAAPPFFSGLSAEPAPIGPIEGARVLAVLGDSVTTDHISPAGVIPAWSPAGQWLQERRHAGRLRPLRSTPRSPRGHDAGTKDPLRRPCRAGGTFHDLQPEAS
jgi:aconitate hydratase